MCGLTTPESENDDNHHRRRTISQESHHSPILQAKLLNLAYRMLKHPHHKALLNPHHLVSHVRWTAVHVLPAWPGTKRERGTTHIRNLLRNFAVPESRVI